MPRNPELMRPCDTGLLLIDAQERLLKVVPDKYMQHAHHWLILHGRYVCKARKPECPTCIVRDLCAFKDKTKAE